MKRIDRLKRDARQATTFRRHVLGTFSHFDNDRQAVACCRVCGMSVNVNTRPLPNEIDIGGEAVALNCVKGNA